MMDSFLKKKKHFQFSLSVWHIGAIAGLLLLIPYTLWEVFWYNRIGPEAIKPHTYIVALSALLWLFLMPATFFSFIRKNMFLWLIYLGLCLGVGEVHPFTMAPMYNKFPNRAYSFKLTDKRGIIIPIKDYYTVNSGGLSHKFTTLQQKLNIKSSPEEYSNETLYLLGKQLLDELQNSELKKPDTDTLQLYLVCSYLHNDTITTTERLMYADNVKR